MILDTIGFWTAGFWTAVGTIGIFFATVLLVYVARNQLISIREENTKSRTLYYCEKYDLDPVIHLSFEKIMSYRLNPSSISNPRELKPYISTILNYLDGIAIGVNQGLYDKSIVEDHLKTIILEHVSAYLEPAEEAKKFGLNQKDYSHVMDLAKNFNAPVTIYKGSVISKLTKR